MAKVNIEIGKEYKFKHEVLEVPRDCPHEVHLGNDLVFFDELYLLAHANGSGVARVGKRGICPPHFFGIVDKTY